jgi:DNA primase
VSSDRAAVTRQVKEANDIVDVIGAYVALRPAGTVFKGLCPFHDDRHPSFTVDPRWQNYRCWACNKTGDVFQFLMEFERIDFLEARELLARRAGISLEKTADGPQQRTRALMLDCVRWAAEQYQHCLLGTFDNADDLLAETSRRYVGERGLSGETVRRFGLGYAPLSGDWLIQKAEAQRLPLDVLETVGLIAKRNEGRGYYDRFRDRIMFPIRDIRGQTVGFGGRILPSSPLSDRAPKYYNSADTPLFSKSELLYGLDQARQASDKAGYLAVVEGYTDVLMAHQHGIAPVVATMGTALNERHVRNLRRYAPRVILVFDADAGGTTGVDRALEIFVSQDVDLAIATLPEGLDPCDLLNQDNGTERFRQVLAGAVDALEFTISRMTAGDATSTIAGRAKAVDTVLSMLALAPQMPGQAGQVRRELLVSRIAQRFALSEETVWARLKELRTERQASGGRKPPVSATQNRGLTPPARQDSDEAERSAPALPRERSLLEVLLAQPDLVAAAAAEIKPEEIKHPGLRQLLEGLYLLYSRGETPELDALRPTIENPRLAEYALRMKDDGRQLPNRAACLRDLLAEFRMLRERPRKQELQNQLHAASDPAVYLELLKQLQNQSVEVESGAPASPAARP